MPTKIEKLFTNMAKAVHSGKLTPGQIDKEVTSFVANNLLKGVFTGFDGDFDTVDYDTPDFKMLSHLEKNTYWFSCAKNYQEVVELNEALRDGQRILPYKEFETKAFAINEKYNANYLKAEYNHAVASSQMARRWVDIQEAKATHGCLRYDTVGDSRVRLEHQSLEGITKPIDDPFWDTWYPPNGWNCRCDVQQVMCSKITADENIITPTDTPKIFQTNTAKKGMVYPEGHPYYSIPNKNLNDVLKASEDFWKEKTNAYKKVQSYKNGGSLSIHSLNDDINDIKDNIVKFEPIAKNGDKVKILPQSKVPGVKNVDATINEITAEHKRLTSTIAKTAKYEIQKAKEQGANILVLQLINYKDVVEVNRMLRYAFIHQGKPINQSINEVYLMNSKDKYEILSNAEIVDKTSSYFKKLKKLFK